MKKKKGRPKKNANLNLHELDSSKHLNTKNIFPPNKMVLGKEAGLLKKDDEFIVRMSSEHVDVFITLLDRFKGKNKNIHIVFTKTGLIFLQSRAEVKNDMVIFECKIFPDNLLKYEMKDINTNEILQIDIERFYKIFKSMPKHHEFTLLLYNEDKEGAKKLFRIVDNDASDKQKGYTDSKLSLNTILRYYPVKTKAAEYDCIIMMESEAFQSACKRLSSFSNLLIITYIKADNNIEFGINTGSLIMENKRTSSKRLVFLKTPDTDIKNIYNMESFQKYIKMSKISTVVKLYMSFDQPLIIEYTIEPGLGTFQIFVQPQNKISGII